LGGHWHLAGWGGDVNAERPSAVGASKPEPHPEAQPIHLPQDAKDPLRPVWYRVHRDHEYAPSNVEARFLCERITKERHEAAKLRGEVDVLVGRLAHAEGAISELSDEALRQHIDWMHFHELAMADPFKAESEALAYTRSVRHKTCEARDVQDPQAGEETP
jgi:hypothetical protein